MLIVDEIPIKLYGNEIKIFADPEFLLPNLLGREMVKVDGKEFTAQIPMRGGGAMIAFGSIMVSSNSVTYFIDIAGYGKGKGGKIKLTLNSSTIRIEIDMKLPIEILNAGVIKGRVKDFKTKIEELLRQERIRRKL
ncbi:STK_08120 family protein [Acidianus sp. RZ1]|uniref:STK_08120 family protein n=1 Tax=Acidianus sp. RZ1 TaxID=1540082 RepID=UPI001492DB4A|nr:STK_08120 family protein [Acidianus sp. RZ1]NON61259.1 DUF3211 family protein [Acidianus sp. RZ1]